MRKKMVSLLLSLLMCFSASAGCAPEQEKEPPEEPAVAGTELFCDTDFTAFVLSLLLISVFLFSVRWIWNGYLVPSSIINWMSLEGCCYYLEKVSVELMVDVYKQSYGFSFKCSSMTNNVRMYCCILFILTLIHYCIMHFILPSWVLKRPIKIT